VEPDYLPDSEVFFFQLCLYAMKNLHLGRMYIPPRGGVHRGGYPLFEVQGQEGVRGKISRRITFLVNVYSNFIVKLGHSL